MIIEFADLDSEDVRQLLELHIDAAKQQVASHAYSLAKLRDPGIRMFSMRDTYGRLMGLAGIRFLSSSHAEIKSMRTHPDFLRRGVARSLLEKIEAECRGRGVERVSLETHPTPAYKAALSLYRKLGYQDCGPFGDHGDDPKSIYMTKYL